MVCWEHDTIPSGYLTVRHGKSPFLIGKPSINGSFPMAMLNNQRVYRDVNGLEGLSDFEVDHGGTTFLNMFQSLMSQFFTFLNTNDWMEWCMFIFDRPMSY